MITIVEGRPGMGKSVYLVGQILYYLQRGVDVYTNVSIVIPPDKYKKAKLVYFKQFEELLHVTQGVIIADEIQVYLNSRKWDSLPVEFQLLLQQHRKKGLDIIGATQSVKRADVVFRELIQRFYAVRKIISFKVRGYAFGFFIVREYDADSLEGKADQREQIGWGWLNFVDPTTFSMYDTTQLYNPTPMLGRRQVHEVVYVEETKIVPKTVKRTDLET